MRRLRGRLAVVTGAASGIGQALALQLADRGCALAAVDIDRGGLEALVEAVRARGVRAEAFVADVADRERMRALPDEVIARLGEVQILVNNAGVSVGASFAEHSFEDLDWILGIDLYGVLHGCKFFLPHLLRQDEAHIVNLSSMFGFLGLAGQSSYCVAKAGVKALSEALWTELAATPVGVTSVHPGGIRTNIIRAARIADEEGKQQGIAQIERWGHSPEMAARKIVRAIERNRPRVRIGAEAVALDVAKRLFPVATHRLLTAFYLRSPSTERARERAAEEHGEKHGEKSPPHGG